MIICYPYMKNGNRWSTVRWRIVYNLLQRRAFLCMGYERHLALRLSRMKLQNHSYGKLILQVVVLKNTFSNMYLYIYTKHKLYSEK